MMKISRKTIKKLYQVINILNDSKTDIKTVMSFCIIILSKDLCLVQLKTLKVDFISMVHNLNWV